MDNVSIINDVVDAAFSDSDELIVRAFEFNKDRKNELLFFFKPECFLSGSPENAGRIVEMVFDKFSRYKTEVSGALLLRGNRLDELSIMDRHYGFINKLSRNASGMVGEEELSKIRDSLDTGGSGDCRVLGGHEFLERFGGFDEKSLDDLWLTKKSVKLRSGFYVQKYNVNGEDIILVNGFHPAQLRHFTDPTHRIVVLLLHSDADWKGLKHGMVGDTFPEKAEKDSIRGELFSNSAAYGIPEVSISNNCVHLSAGPFEALFEMDNFLKDIQGVAFDLKKTNMYRLMTGRGLAAGDVERCIQNPVTQINGKSTDLFTLTEDRDSEDAVSDFIRYFT
ncbi:MAG: hypothetical protein GXP49_05225 [Deltaproteobacteria bacterium]|nr:hypothetical protein [Deltaproteobacteria bacterium]